MRGWSRIERSGRRGLIRSSSTCDAPPNRSAQVQRNTSERLPGCLLRWRVGAHRRRRRHPIRTPPPLPDPRRLGRDHESGAAGGMVAAVRRRHHGRPPEGGQMVFAARGDEPVTMTCTILRVEPPMLLEHTHADAASYLRWELEPVDTGCVLRLSHFVTDTAGAIDNCYVVGLHA